MPVWLQKLVIQALKQTLTPEKMKEFKTNVIAQLRELPKKTPEIIVDDALVETVVLFLEV